MNVKQIEAALADLLNNAGVSTRCVLAGVEVSEARTFDEIGCTGNGLSVTLADGSSFSLTLRVGEGVGNARGR